MLNYNIVQLTVAYLQIVLTMGKFIISQHSGTNIALALNYKFLRELGGYKYKYKLRNLIL